MACEHCGQACCGPEDERFTSPFVVRRQMMAALRTFLLAAVQPNVLSPELDQSKDRPSTTVAFGLNQ